MEEIKKEVEIVADQPISIEKEYYTKAEVDALLNKNLVDIIKRFTDIQPSKPQQENSEPKSYKF